MFHIFRPFWLLEMRNISVVGERELLDIFASVPIQLCQNVAAWRSEKRFCLFLFLGESCLGPSLSIFSPPIFLVGAAAVGRVVFIYQLLNCPVPHPVVPLGSPLSLSPFSARSTIHLSLAFKETRRFPTLLFFVCFFFSASVLILSFVLRIRVTVIAAVSPRPGQVDCSPPSYWSLDSDMILNRTTVIPCLIAHHFADLVFLCWSMPPPAGLTVTAIKSTPFFFDWFNNVYYIHSLRTDRVSRWMSANRKRIWANAG